MRRPSVDRKAKAAGQLGAWSLGDVQNPKPQKHLERFACTKYKRHEHQWLNGAVNRVCSVCGLTEPKPEALAQIAAEGVK